MLHQVMSDGLGRERPRRQSGVTWEYSVLTLKVIWRVDPERASIHNTTGGLSPCRCQRASALSCSLQKFLAIVSVNLGVLNLLPVHCGRRACDRSEGGKVRFRGGHAAWAKVD